jgi:Uma2 family endonuclease
MSTATEQSQRLILGDVSWKEYVRLLRALENRHLRITYDRGVLEIMTLSFEHENEGYLLCRLVDVLTEELNLPVQGGGSTTFKRRKHQRGLEADGCWWIANEAQVRGKTRIDLRRDPPPDLVAEIDVTRSSLNRMTIYARLRIPEVWRYDGKSLMFFALDQNSYKEVETSVAFPGFEAAEILPFLKLYKQEDQTTIVRRFRAWVQSRIRTP